MAAGSAQTQNAPARAQLSQGSVCGQLSPGISQKQNVPAHAIVPTSQTWLQPPAPQARRQALLHDARCWMAALASQQEGCWHVMAHAMQKELLAMTLQSERSGLE